MADLGISAASLTSALAAQRPTAAPIGSTAATGVGAAGGGFGDALGKALADVNALQLDAAQAARTLASGKTQDMTEAVVTMEKASIAFQFALQIRNKLLEAYQDIMRMPV
jgi:flagellar hook-basal body complex protein FliE